MEIYEKSTFRKYYEWTYGTLTWFRSQRPQSKRILIGKRVCNGGEGNRKKKQDFNFFCFFSVRECTVFNTVHTSKTQKFGLRNLNFI